MTTWTNDGGEVELRADGGEHDLVLTDLGRARCLYRVSRIRGPVGNEEEQWDAYRIVHPRDAPDLTGQYLVLKSSRLFHADGTAEDQLLWWFVPALIEQPPSSSCADLEAWFFEGMFKVHRVFGSFGAARAALAIVETASLPGAIAAVARDVARGATVDLGESHIDSMPFAAASRYDEDEPAPVHGNYACRWTWRIAFGASTARGRGLAVVELQWSDLNRTRGDENGGPGGDFESSVRLLLPADQDDAVAAVRDGVGVPLELKR